MSENWNESIKEPSLMDSKILTLPVRNVINLANCVDKDIVIASWSVFKSINESCSNNTMHTTPDIIVPSLNNYSTIWRVHFNSTFISHSLQRYISLYLRFFGWKNPSNYGGFVNCVYELGIGNKNNMFIYSKKGGIRKFIGMQCFGWAEFLEFDRAKELLSDPENKIMLSLSVLQEECFFLPPQSFMKPSCDENVQNLIKNEPCITPSSNSVCENTLKKMRELKSVKNFRISVYSSDGKELSVSSLVIAACCPILYKKLQIDPNKTATEIESEKATINLNHDYLTVKNFIIYLKLETLPQNVDEMKALINLATALKLTELQKSLIERLFLSLTVENFVQIALISKEIDITTIDELDLAVLRSFLAIHFREIKQSEMYKIMVDPELEKLLLHILFQ